MPQKLIIRAPFMAVQPCEIVFDRFLLLIGEQASGKSTIAKLIYFFQSILPVDCVGFCLDKKNQNLEQNDFEYKFSNNIAHLFQETFGLDMKNVNISFEYDAKKNVNILHSEKNRLESNCNFGKDVFQKQAEILPHFFEHSRFGESTQGSELIKGIEGLLNVKITNNLFAIAGRINTVAYSEFFEKEFYANVKIRIDKKQLNKQYSIDDMLMLGFLRRVIDIKEWIKDDNDLIKRANKHDEDAVDILNTYQDQIYPIIGTDEDGWEIRERREDIILMQGAIKKILKADYEIDNDNEFLKINGSLLPISQTSSGQQEALRILQDLQLIIERKWENYIRVVEEPEAHLYPLAQKEMVDLFALMLNTNENNRLIITTHSPYILACVNILLFANYVANTAPETESNILQSVKKEFWLNGDMFSAYSIGHAEAYCTNIKSPTTGLIKQSYLDLISKQLGFQYQELYNLLVQKHV